MADWQRRVLLALVVSLGVSACATSPEVSSPSPRSSGTSARDRVAFGCALERGARDADSGARHYGNLAARELFHAALAAEKGYVLAAQLWNATDVVLEENTAKAREELLSLCADEGFTDSASMSDLRSYMCGTIGDLRRERPTLESFGPEDTQEKPGDPRRRDLAFVGIAMFLLALEVDDRWLESPNLLPSDTSGTTADEGHYQAALRHHATQCASAGAETIRPSTP